MRVQDTSEYPRPIHDYRDASLYPIENDSSVLWAWEFLRRDALFQLSCDEKREADEEKLNEEEYRHVETFGPCCGSWHYMENHDTADAYSNHLYDIGAFPLHVCGPLAGPDITCDLNSYDPETRDFKLKNHMSSMFSEFGLALTYAREEHEGIDDRLLIVALDAGQPLKAQIKRLEKLHADAQKTLQSTAKQRDPKDKTLAPPAIRARGLSTLLRILDGIASGASHNDIRDQLQLFEEKDYKRRLDRAQRFLSGEYRRLQVGRK